MSEELDRVDCLRFPGDAPDTVRLVPAGLGDRVVAAHREEGRRRARITLVAAVLVTLMTGVGAVVVLGPTPVAAAGTLLVGIVSLYAARRTPAGTARAAPELLETDVPAEVARERYEVAAASGNPFDSGERGGEAAAERNDARREAG